MSSATIAARPSGALPRVPLALVVAALVLAVGIGAIIGARAASTSTLTAPAAAGPQIKHHNAFPAAPAPTLADYRELVAKLAAAESRGDHQAVARFDQALDDMLTPAMIGTIYQQREKLAASLEWAQEHRDSHNRAIVSRELAALCGAGAVRAELDFCN